MENQELLKSTGQENGKKEIIDFGGFVYEHDSDYNMQAFNNFIKNAPPVSPVDRSQAPFRDYLENTPDQWKYVSAQEVESYLSQKFFFDTGTISHRDMSQLFSLDTYSGDKNIKVPLDLVVNAKGFEDWRGRDPKLYTKTWGSIYGGGDSKSLDVIKHYAGMSTNWPPVFRMVMFVQPNGKVFFDNGSGDSHRMAAAILRGFEFIETQGVDAYSLSKDYI